jgi:hypothetical protein
MVMVFSNYTNTTTAYCYGDVFYEHHEDIHDKPFIMAGYNVIDIEYLTAKIMRSTRFVNPGLARCLLK